MYSHRFSGKIFSNTPVLRAVSSDHPVSQPDGSQRKGRHMQIGTHHRIGRIPHKIALIFIDSPGTDQHHRIYREHSHLIYNRINRMLSSVEYDQIEFRKLLHLSPHMGLHGHPSVTIIGNKSDMLSLRIQVFYQLNIFCNIIVVSKTGYLSVFSQGFFKIRTFGFPIF